MTAPHSTFCVLGGANAKGSKTCQDCVYVDEEWEGKYGLYIVADGHGGDGHIAAGIATDFLPTAIASALDATFPAWRTLDVSSPSVARQKSIATSFCNAMKTAFAAAHQAVDKTVSAFGGATCVVCIRMGRLIVTASCGDSRAVLALHGDPDAATPPKEERRSQRGGFGWGEDDFSGTPDFSHDIIALTVEHTPLNQNEYARIAKAGGYVASTSTHGPGPPGPLRVWRGPGPPRAGDVGLAMTRSIGDRHLKASGVICDPVVSLQWAPRRSHATLALGSDGIFDVLPLPHVIAISTDTIKPSASAQLQQDAATAFRASRGCPAPRGDARYRAGIAHDSAAAVSPAARLVMAARTRWELLSPQRIDDISAIIVALSPAPARPTKRARPQPVQQPLAAQPNDPLPAGPRAIALPPAESLTKGLTAADQPAHAQPSALSPSPGRVSTPPDSPRSRIVGGSVLSGASLPSSGPAPHPRAGSGHFSPAAGKLPGSPVGLPRDLSPATRRTPGSDLSGQIRTTQDLTATSLQAVAGPPRAHGSAVSIGGPRSMASMGLETAASSSVTPSVREQGAGSALRSVAASPSEHVRSGPVGGFMRAVQRRFVRQRKVTPRADDEAAVTVTDGGAQD